MTASYYPNKDNDFRKSRVFVTSSANTYSVNIPAGTYKPVFQDVQSPVTVGSVTFTSTRSLVSFTTTQSSLTFRNTVSSSISWTSRTPFTNNTIVSATFGNNVFLISANSNVLRSSTDGITWTSRNPGFGSSNVSAVGFANNLFVAAGQGGRISTSTDGITWTSRTPGTTLNINPDCIDYGNGLWIIGTNAGAAGTTATIITSPDGITWTSRNPGFPPDANITSVAAGTSYGLPRYVASCDVSPRIRSSTDGATWGNEFVPGVVISSLLYANGLFLAGGDAGALFTSTDGILWTTRDSTFRANNIRKLVYSNGIYFAFGAANNIPVEAGGLATSTDGITWTARAFNSFSGTEMQAGAVGSGLDDGIVIAAGASGEVYSANIFISFGSQSLTLRHLGNPIPLA